ncbi:hypothetical protein GQ457_17G008420 [Hibiscus cannabinus]
MSCSIHRFWWSGKGSARGWPLVAWDDICLPKAAGGIGFKDLHLFNIALLGKQIWRLLSAPGSLLYRTVGSRLRDAGLSDRACLLCGVGFEDVLHVLRDCPDSSTALRQAGFANFLLSADQATVVDLAWICDFFSFPNPCGFAKPIPVHGPASTVEDSALFVGLEFAIANAWPSALIESDAAVLVNKLHRPTADLSLLGDMLAPSRALLAANAARLRVGFASGLANIAPHTLASWACHNNDVISFSSICLELISRIVLDDLSSSFY